MIDIASLPDDLARNIWKVYISKYVIHHIAFARWGYSDTFDVSTYDALPLYQFKWGSEELLFTETPGEGFTWF